MSTINIREYEGPIKIGSREFAFGIVANFPEPVMRDAYDLLANNDILTVLKSNGDTCYNLWFWVDGRWTCEPVGSFTITTPDGTPLVVKGEK